MQNLQQLRQCLLQQMMLLVEEARSVVKLSSTRHPSRKVSLFWTTCRDSGHPKRKQDERLYHGKLQFKNRRNL